MSWRVLRAANIVALFEVVYAGEQLHSSPPVLDEVSQFCVNTIEHTSNQFRTLLLRIFIH